VIFSEKIGTSVLATLTDDYTAGHVEILVYFKYYLSSYVNYSWIVNRFAACQLVESFGNPLTSFGDD